MIKMITFIETLSILPLFIPILAPPETKFGGNGYSEVSESAKNESEKWWGRKRNQRFTTNTLEVRENLPILPLLEPFWHPQGPNLAVTDFQRYPKVQKMSPAGRKMVGQKRNEGFITNTLKVMQIYSFTPFLDPFWHPHGPNLGTKIFRSCLKVTKKTSAS